MIGPSAALEETAGLEEPVARGALGVRVVRRSREVRVVMVESAEQVGLAEVAVWEE